MMAPVRDPFHRVRIGLVALVIVAVGMAAVMSAQSAAMQHQLNYSRENEYEADRVGIGVMALIAFALIRIPLANAGDPNEPAPPAAIM